MGMNVGSGSAEPDVMVELNTTPLIDLMLVLIVMLIMSLPPQTHAVKLDMPVTTPPENPEKPPVIDIVVDFDGTIYWNSEVISGGDQLKSYLSQAAHAEPRPEIHLKPNKLAKYDYVAKVLATAQRLGVKNIGILGNEALE
ncbi:biopolymer transporter ExbD [Cellvibrio zantedeschiae]|uniref:Biopolymer transporter ExbD n=1 Tax=Cellvibrio zantedeschiae TaxID=1237077 RepID=A0ABQ3B8H4_9GAMM|nr:biopolymer transporter ExbD [Cellvibrio zantedeschiae]GGY84042.1 biopolymer transporter ExbD [Cellvibrio zantedeschiae]